VVAEQQLGGERLFEPRSQAKGHGNALPKSSCRRGTRDASGAAQAHGGMRDTTRAQGRHLAAQWPEGVSMRQPNAHKSSASPMLHGRHARRLHARLRAQRSAYSSPARSALSGLHQNAAHLHGQCASSPRISRPSPQALETACVRLPCSSPPLPPSPPVHVKMASSVPQLPR
jgi:hypothetical protein